MEQKMQELIEGSLKIQEDAMTDNEMPETITFGEVRAMGERFISVVINGETKCEIMKSAEYTRSDLCVPRAATDKLIEALKKVCGYDYDGLNRSCYDMNDCQDVAAEAITEYEQKHGEKK